jgi:hypothetical protein
VSPGIRNRALETPSKRRSPVNFSATPTPTPSSIRRSNRDKSVVSAKEKSVALPEEDQIPLRLWVPGGEGKEADGCWKVEHDIPSDLLAFLKDALYSKIFGPTKIRDWEKMKPDNKICVLGVCVSRAPQSDAPSDEELLVACKVCTAVRKSGQRGKYHEGRPCGRLMKEGVGILPLLKNVRGEKDWNEKGFWVNNPK